MAITLPTNVRGPALDLELPAAAGAMEVHLRNNTTGRTLTVLLPAGWGGEDLTLDWYRKTIRDQTGADRSALLDPEDSELWISPSAFLQGAENDVEIEVTPAPAAYSDFSSESGVVTGDTLSDGAHTWQGAGDPDDFSASEGRLVRTAVSDAGTDAPPQTQSGRIITVKSLSLAAMRCQMDFEHNPGGNVVPGLVARYVDVSNFFVAVFYSTLVVAAKRVAGVTTVLKSESVPALTAGEFYRARVNVAANGAYEVLLAPKEDALASILSGTDSTHLAAGKTLASGSAGIADHRPSATALTRRFDNFKAWDRTPAAYIAKATLRWEQGYY